MQAQADQHGGEADLEALGAGGAALDMGEGGGEAGARHGLEHDVGQVAFGQARRDCRAQGNEAVGLLQPVELGEGRLVLDQAQIGVGRQAGEGA